MPKNTISFDDTADKLFTYICTLYQPGCRFPYPLQKGQKGSLLGTLFASFIAYMLHREHQLPGRKQICDEIIALHNPDTGLIEDPDLELSHFMNTATHSQEYVTLQTTCFSYACLHALGESFDGRVPWLTPLLEEGELERWLDQLDWQNPWLVSNLDMFAGIFLLQWQSYDQEDTSVARAVDSYFKWHDKNQVSCTGFWGNQDDLLNAMAGAYHILIHYDYSGAHINHARKIIDSTLGLVCRDGLFVYGGGGGSCEDMDAIDILVRLSQVTDYRQDDVQRVLLRAAAMLGLGQNTDGGFSWRVQPRLRNMIQIPSRSGMDTNLIFGFVHNIAYRLLHRSHYCSTHNYSSLSCYPYTLMESDMWSSWFRPLSLAFIAQRYPEGFSHTCNWRMPFWPGLGYDPFRVSAISEPRCVNYK